MTIDAEPPRDEEVERGIAAIEQYLRDQASTTPAKHTPATSGDEDTPADAEDDDPAGEETGAVEPYRPTPDRKSTRLNSSHVKISYAVFRLKKKKHHRQ